MPKSAENLRTGFTTGACAAAAAKAALLALCRQQASQTVSIRLPNGQVVAFTLHTCEFTTDEGRCSVIKDAGDDPDVTHLAEIQACVRWSDQPGVRFQRGVGVGLVTKPGLPIPPGEPAINPVPRQSIAENLRAAFAELGVPERGLVIVISVPRGEELAKKTFNPRLGIVGGISILGTTGIVVPYSTAAWLASVTQGIDVAVVQECKHLVLTVGARGERFAQRLFDLPEIAFIQIGPFFGDSLRHCAKTGVEGAVLVAMVGKLAKFAAGNDSVHSSNSRQDFEFLANIARRAGAGSDLLERIVQANTAQEVASMIAEQGLNGFHDLVCTEAWIFAQTLTAGKFPLEVLLTSQDGEVLGKHPRG